MPMVPIDQLSGPQFGTVAIVGKPKTGKTQSIRTLHSFLVKNSLPSNIAVFDLDEDGAEPLIRIARTEKWLNDLELYRYNVRGSRIGKKETPERSRIPTEMFIDETAALYDRLDTQTGHWKEGLNPKTGHTFALGAVVIDSMTALNERWFDYIMVLQQREIGGTSTDGKLITFAQWMMIKAKILETVRSIKALPCYGVSIFHEVLLQEEIPGPKPEDTKTTGNVFWVPKIQGDLCTTIQKEFGAVMHTKVEGERYLWITKPDDRITSAGTRSKEGLPRTVPQDFAEILAT